MSSSFPSSLPSSSDARSHASSIAGLPLEHLARLPAVDAPENVRPPLLVMSHGVGGNEHNLFGLAARLDPRFLVLSTRAPLVRGPDSFAWFNATFLPEGTVIAPDQLEASLQRFLAFLREAPDAYGADPARLYLFGFSQGAIMSLVAALCEPERVAGVVALSGRIPREAFPWFAAPVRTEGAPIFVAHGTHDAIIRVGEARNAREMLERQRVALDYHEYDLDHSISKQVFTDADDWLRARLASPPWRDSQR